MQNLEDRPPAPLPRPTIRRFHGTSDRDSQGYLLPTDGQPRSSGVYSYAYQDRIDSIMASLLWFFRGRHNAPSPPATMAARNIQRRRQEPTLPNSEDFLHETFDQTETSLNHGELLSSPEVQDGSELGACGLDARAPSREAVSSASTSGTSAKYLYEKIKENEMMPKESDETTTGL